MKEVWLSEIDSDTYNKEYLSFVAGQRAGKPSLEGDMLIVDNPESRFYEPEQNVEPPLEVPVIHLSQLPLEFHIHPQRTRGRR